MPGDLGGAGPWVAGAPGSPVPSGAVVSVTEYSSSLQSPYLQGRVAIGVDRVPRYHPACPDNSGPLICRL